MHDKTLNHHVLVGLHRKDVVRKVALEFFTWIVGRNEEYCCKQSRFCDIDLQLAEEGTDKETPSRCMCLQKKSVDGTKLQKHQCPIVFLCSSATAPVINLTLTMDDVSKLSALSILEALTKKRETLFERTVEEETDPLVFETLGRIGEAVSPQSSAVKQVDLLATLLTTTDDENAFLVGECLTKTGNGRLLKGLQKEIAALEETGAFQEAAMGTDRRKDTNARGDRRIWARRNEVSDHEALSRIVVLLEDFRKSVQKQMEALGSACPAYSRRKHPSLEHSEVQVAIFPSYGARFVRHKDVSSSKGNSSIHNRFLTVIFYVGDPSDVCLGDGNTENEKGGGGEGPVQSTWSPKLGGALRLHLRTRQVDIAPLGGRFVIFRSDLVEHEVLPSSHRRVAVSSWLSFAPERSKTADTGGSAATETLAQSDDEIQQKTADGGRETKDVQLPVQEEGGERL
uniref:Prolyl 4-hydroxylase alpha subunit domain-containing protein n=1 Tax=Chromera velia CCMP2878 TaxID=1169474 RepID=A0A0G4GKR3_9ALVE|eukprot:Cvel_22358.t1-p1 / transcript=Cvel_22358.t1 / gene=Cvel_22358 / organism=Chromera_velia_CCMP2878 / gene_product=Prolyl 4-hydroxylase subunit alpha, putative / transcript_product=Prolyl 4-hydroxylase subunit alpha, putative / location=Cvel_scaffold2189:30674-32035(-) / protein_length=454 / sequence_SO=supercontig / SO=protein_coding / is_pseudo=false